MLQLKQVYRSFQALKVLQGVNATIARGALTGLIGPSGGGKSVLLKIIAGIEQLDSGSVELDPNDRTISLMFQEGALFDSLNLFDNVAFPLVAGRVPSITLPKVELESVRIEVERILGRVGLRKAAFKFPGQISGGMRRRASLARALVSRPQVLLLDDPTAGLDPVSSSLIMELIQELHADYKPTTIIVSHDLRRLLPAVSQVLGLFNGRICFSGTPHEILARGDEELRSFVACRYDLSTQPNSPQTMQP